jgi:hypothetical protein
VANNAETTPEGEFGKRYQFYEVFQKEVELINARRTRDGRPIFALEDEVPPDAAGERFLRPPKDAHVVGLAHSGGGIRSAAFCLGVLQALDATKVLKQVDYLSTVSGGGYIGCSLTAALDADADFPFTSRLAENETPALQHIRDHSNYLFPSGASDFLHNASIYARGLIVNVVLVAPVLLAASALTLLYYSLRGPIGEKIAVLNPFGLKHFFLSLDLALLLFAVGIVWGFFQSRKAGETKAEIPGLWTKAVGSLVIAFFVVLFCELQPFILDAMVDEKGNVSVVAKRWIDTLSAILAPVGAVIAFLASKLGEYVKSAAQSPKWSMQMKGLALKAAIHVGGLILPLVIWVLYLDVTHWGLCINGTYKCEAPTWLAHVARATFDWPGYSATALYIAVALACFILSFFMRPNANSLHPLYRDRLGTAFLFKPASQLGEDDDLPPARPLLSAISGLNGPYHLINAALNIQQSKTANKRGRNADFFVFSQKFVGSKSTDYVATCDVEEVAIGFDLATAMAVSGAAVSSNMGAESIKPLTATLALLNIRLGYWLRNPRHLAHAGPPDASGQAPTMTAFRRRNNILANYYFLGEVFGLLNEHRKSVYLTDGGHIENLGVYELLRRRCSVIIAVDVDADPQMAFGSFNTLERYALIDLGVRIDLPWRKIADESLKTSQAIDDKSDTPKHHGPHCAIGEIFYPTGRKGILIYIKASLTGDENDCVFDYKKRHSDFPHETTLDQWFSEEQFEAYRALGFHAAYGLFSGGDRFAHLDLHENPDVPAQVGLLNDLFAVTLFEPSAA